MTNPKDVETRKLGRKGEQKVHAALNMDHWEFKREIGEDNGRDCIIEHQENDRWNNRKIEGQIKGKSNPDYILGNKFISIPLEIRTLKYALGTSMPFVLFVADFSKDKVYYQCIQDYFITDKTLFHKIEDNKDTINIRIPIVNCLNESDDLLVEMLNNTYLDGPGIQLRKYRK